MGDRSIQSRLGEGFGGLHVDSLDANSSATDVFTEARTVDGESVFVSPEAAQALDAAESRTWTVHVAGHAWDRLKAALDAWRSGR